VQDIKKNTRSRGCSLNGDPLGMKYTELIPVLAKAIQEQQTRIEELENTKKKI
jgi:hypothetical protein